MFDLFDISADTFFLLGNGAGLLILLLIVFTRSAHKGAPPKPLR